MDLREVGYDGRDWINLAQHRDQWRAYVRAAMNSGFLKSQKNDAETDLEEKKELAGSLLRRNCLVKDALEGLSLMLAGNEFQSLGRAIVKEDEYEEVRWDGIVSIVSWRERVFRLWWEERTEELSAALTRPSRNGTDANSQST
ncbi:hypothetical protein ANN_13821 [Periplaneta americana]|uniref:Uncharacterized protein n=1 Tax=Periplaneta americana TaxID=6978 RepID=A0ABQ8SW36_PERAM|nr:hypothetical protein ANN_13821 [Periplaneta americana]